MWKSLLSDIGEIFTSAWADRTKTRLRETHVVWQK